MFANAPYTFEPPDAATAELVRTMYEEDLALEQALSYAEQIQLSIAINDSDVPQTPGLPPRYPTVEETGSLIAARARLNSLDFAGDLRMKAEEEEMQRRLGGDRTIALALSAKLEATKRREILDFEYSRRLQAVDTQGQRDIDEMEGMDIDSLLGRARVADMMVRLAFAFVVLIF